VGVPEAVRLAVRVVDWPTSEGLTELVRLTVEKLRTT